MKTSSAVRETISRVVARPSCGGRDVEEGQLVGTLGVVAPGQLDRVAGVAEVLEVHALDDAPRVDVEAGDDADGEAHPAALPPSVEPVDTRASASRNVNRSS